MYIRVYPFATSLALCLNSLLIYSPAIRGGSDMSSIYFSSGKDVASLNRSDVSASAETRHQKCTRMHTFDEATTQMYPSSAFANRGGRYKELGKKVPQAYLRYVEDTFLPCDAVDAPLFANDQLIFSK